MDLASDNNRSYKSDGTEIRDGVLRIGSPNSGGTLWRSVAHLPYEGYLNRQSLVVRAAVSYETIVNPGPTFPSTLIHANAFGFNGVGQQLGTQNLAGYAEFDHLNSPALTDYMRSVFDANTPGAYFMARGDERPTAYTYKPVSPRLDLTLDDLPTVATLESPLNGATGVSVEPLLTASATDPDGDPVLYRFQVATDLSFSAAAMKWESPFQERAVPARVPATLLAANSVNRQPVLMSTNRE